MNNDNNKLPDINPDISHWFNDPYTLSMDDSLTDEELQLQQSRESVLARYSIHDEELKQFDFLIKQAVDKILANSFNIQTPSELGLIRDQRWAVRVLFLLKRVIESGNYEKVEDIHLEELLASRFDDANTYATLSCGHIKGVMPFVVSRASNLLKVRQPQTISDLSRVIATSFLTPTTHHGGTSQAPIIYREQIHNALKQCMGDSCDQIDEVMSYFTASCIMSVESCREVFDTHSLQNGLTSSQIREVWRELSQSPRPAPSAASAISLAILFYVVSYLKTHDPKAFYLTLIDCEWEGVLPEILIEMQEVTGIKIERPDINHSYDSVYINTENRLVWPLNFIRTIGEQSVSRIIIERCANGKFTSLSNFIHRVLLRKQSSRTMSVGRLVSLILAGCFDKIENVPSPRQRHKLIDRLPKEFGLKVSNLELYQGKIYQPLFWKIQQNSISGVDQLDYRFVFERYRKIYPIRRRGAYMSLNEVLKATNHKESVLVCATIFDCVVEPKNPMYDSSRRYYSKLKLRQNNSVVELLIWDKENYRSTVGDLKAIKGKIVIISAKIAYSECFGSNYLEWQEYSTLRQVESMLYGKKINESASK